MAERSSPDSATQERLLRELTASGEPVLCFQAAQEIHRLQQLVDTRASLQPATPTAGWTEGDVALFAARMRGIGLMKPQGYGQIEHDLVRKLLQEFPRLASATGGDAVAGEALRKAAKRAVKLFNTPNNDGLYDAMNDLKAALRSPDAAGTPAEPVKIGDVVEAKVLLDIMNGYLTVHARRDGTFEIRGAERTAEAVREVVLYNANNMHRRIADTQSGFSADAHDVAQPSPEPFQARVDPWLMACFGMEIARDILERNHRFLEEAIELVQANGCTVSEAHQLVDYVYGRDQGEINQEVGGVMVTLAALCLASGVDMHTAAETELARVWTKVEKIRAKHFAKPKFSPLPGYSIPSTTRETRSENSREILEVHNVGYRTQPRPAK